MSRFMPRFERGLWSGEDAFGQGINGRFYVLTWFGLTVEISIGR